MSKKISVESYFIRNNCCFDSFLIDGLVSPSKKIKEIQLETETLVRLTKIKYVEGKRYYEVLEFLV